MKNWADFSAFFSQAQKRAVADVLQRLAQSDNQATLGKQPGTAGLFLEAALRFPEAAVGGVLAGADAGDVIGGQCAHGNEALPG